MDMQEIVSNQTVLFFLSLIGATGTTVMFLVWVLKQITRFVRWEGIVVMVLYIAITVVVYLETDSLVATFWVVTLVNLVTLIFSREIGKLRAKVDR